MERAKIIEMIDSGRMPADSDFNEILNLSSKYPYCSTFRVLLAMGAKEKDDLELKEFINTASIYVQDRSKLYDYVVRDGLLRKIEDEEVSSAVVKKTDEESASSDTSQKEPQAEGDQEVEESFDPVINQDPLEEQIMAAAVTQLGELEIESGLTEEEDKKPTEQAPDKDEKEEHRELSEGRSAFSRFLTTIDHGSDESQPARAIIDKFISEDRKITPAKKAFFSPTQMGKMSLMEDDSFVTETLAKIYERQGDFKKAAKAYKNLSLKYPEKRRYFAALQKRAEEQS